MSHNSKLINKLTKQIYQGFAPQLNASQHQRHASAQAMTELYEHLCRASATERSSVAKQKLLSMFNDFEMQEYKNAKKRKKDVALCSAVDPQADQSIIKLANDEHENLNLGVRIHTDKYVGCTRLRTLHSLLERIDNKGFER